MCNVSEPATDIPPDNSSTKCSVENVDGDVMPLNPKVIIPEDRAPPPEPGETALPVKCVTLEEEQQPQSDRPISGINSEPADCLSRYNSEVAAQLTEKIKVVKDAFKDITNK